MTMFTDLLKPLLYIYAIVGGGIVLAIAGMAYLIGRWG
jgi:hypothetical protein